MLVGVINPNLVSYSHLAMFLAPAVNFGLLKVSGVIQLQDMDYRTHMMAQQSQIQTLTTTNCKSRIDFKLL